MYKVYSIISCLCIVGMKMRCNVMCLHECTLRSSILRVIATLDKFVCTCMIAYVSACLCVCLLTLMLDSRCQGLS